MAYVKIEPVKDRGSLLFTVNQLSDYVTKDKSTVVEPLAETKQLIDYVIRESKTNINELSEEELLNLGEYREKYVTGINCNVESAVEEFLMVKERFDKKGGVLLQHAYQSFSPSELSHSPEDIRKAHNIGLKWAEEFLDDRFQVIVSTHIDRDHIHNHFLINSVSYVDGKKYEGNLTNLKRAREISDKICMKEGLSVIIPKKSTSMKNSTRKIIEEGRTTYRDMIKEDLLLAMMQGVDFKDFKKIMENKGYIFKYGKHISISPPNYYKNGKRAYIRLRSLKDDRFLYENIEEYMSKKRYTHSETKTSTKIKRLCKITLPKATYRSNYIFRRRYRRSIYIPRFRSYWYMKKIFYGRSIGRKKKYISQKQMRYYQNLANQINLSIKIIHKEKINTVEDVTLRLSYIEKRLKENKKEKTLYYKNKLSDEKTKDTKYENLVKEAKELYEERKVLRYLIYASRNTKNAKLNENKNGERRSVLWDQNKKQQNSTLEF